MYDESESEVAQSCLTLCNLMDCSLPGSSAHGIFQARILEWVAISFSRRSSRPRDWTQVSRIVSRHFTVWATREVPNVWLDQRNWLNCIDTYSGGGQIRGALTLLWENSGSNFPFLAMFFILVDVNKWKPYINKVVQSWERSSPVTSIIKNMYS